MHANRAAFQHPSLASFPLLQMASCRHELILNATFSKRISATFIFSSQTKDNDYSGGCM